MKKITLFFCSFLTIVFMHGEELITNDGEKHSGTINRVEPDGIVLSTDAGIEKVRFVNLSAEVQKKYNYNPQKAAEFSQAVSNAQIAANKRTQAILKQQEAVKHAEAQNAVKENEAKVVAQPNTGLIVKPGKLTVQQIAESPFTLKGFAVQVIGIEDIKKQEVSAGVYEVTIWGEGATRLKAEMTSEQCDAVAKEMQFFIRVKEQDSYRGEIPIEALGNAIRYQGLSNNPTFYWK